ncbi:MAG: hypothetical protein E6356_00315 [Terrisporobacter othiniensis]|uniref:HTH HARE-type domain-containing protein n=1 Tax=Terrisporobacter petrolearius TaxID=1460447 RepID=A0ABZ3FB31_9FIRM|nr:MULTISPECIES: hypothetical protein [Terrisporobacter]MBN9647417.1 hypothetical protein [Terrisporobacter glycolicus]MDU4860515.1 hypothetical protein [Terrisporobacter othiniensis]MDU6993256.1 hypothetical protein [Terrisporobacter othiniensis]SFJ34376.1 hypothetical protein SAMN02910355_2321 [Terrisporobacter glycolicus]HBI92263.1 hypothetical protein [Terrisporobacter hibernicus]
MKYTKEEMDIISEKIVEMLKEKEEMRIGKIAKVLIHSNLVNSSYEVDKILKYKKDLFVSPKMGIWRLVESE